MSEEFEFSRPFALEKLGAGREDLSIAATPSECTALAERLGLRAVGALSADLRVEGRPSLGLVVVKGHLTAEVTQSCVVTLQPFDQKVVESFEQIYSLAENKVDEEEALSPDSPEPLPESGLDLGEEVAQQLSLALDPYPRAPDAELSDDAQDGRANSFAALAKLQRGSLSESDPEG